MDYYYIGDPKFGMHLYRNAIPDSLEIPKRLEETIGNSKHEFFKWSDAMVGYNTKMPEYRDCVDLKVSPIHWPHLTEEFKEIENIYNDTNAVLNTCLEHYQSRYNFTMEYQEAINFVRYGKDQHFSVHSDHGFSYTCTVSSVAYLNDEYEGGELWFPYLDITFKPKKGDVVFFPSTFIYAHASLKITDGIKYSAVTMYDYNDDNHKNHNYGSNVPKYDAPKKVINDDILSPMTEV